MNNIDLPDFSINTRRLVDRQLELWPEHQSFLQKSFQERPLGAMVWTENTSTQVISLVEDSIDIYCQGYRWMCEAVLKEELYFRRHGKYQATSFSDVYEAVYNNPEVMKLYMDGLLLSQVFWRNHTDISGFFEKYISLLQNQFSHLEIGPGHGLLLGRVASEPRCANATAWDISESSLLSTQRCLNRMGVSKPVELKQKNIYDVENTEERYDSIVVAEVLEHLEDPIGALHGIKKILAPGGLCFLNVPCNSPAPDHIFLYSRPDDFFRQIESVGFNIVERYITPGTGWTLERALRHKLPVSCAAIVRV